MATLPRLRSVRSRIYLLPLLIALISGGGLVFALIGDAWWDALSWFAVGLPLAVAERFVVRWPLIQADDRG